VAVTLKTRLPLNDVPALENDWTVLVVCTGTVVLAGSGPVTRIDPAEMFPEPFST
jgi:hypothetical protein